MKFLKFLIIFFIFLVNTNKSISQQIVIDSTDLEEVVVSANKWEQKLTELPNKVVKVNRSKILFTNPQTSADLLGQTGTVFIQKSQLGGGSPMIRGFATNRVLLVMDGVRMNNAIYRSGNLQNIISIDPLSLQEAEVVFGPGSLIYGSDAIGGVMDFHTLQPRFTTNEKLFTRGTAITRYSTANKEKTIHADINLGWKKWAILSSVSYSQFDDLKMGKFGGQESYLRNKYVERINNADIIVTNPDPRVQKFSGYNQLNILHKIRFKPAKNWDLLYSFNYAGTGEAPRYDRLIQVRNNALRFAEWNYGPMLLRMHILQAVHKNSRMYDELRITTSYQDYEESRISRTRNSNNRITQTEKVDAISFNADANKKIGKSEWYYGIENVYNKVGSFGKTENLVNNIAVPSVSRYPDGSTWNTTGIYSSIKMNFHSKYTLTTGLRYSYNILQASFDKTFIQFPYQDANMKDGAITGNAGLVYRPADSWQLNGNISTGYRMPNVDDIGKLFESVPGNITVPNPELSPEYAWNFEMGMIKNEPNEFRIELTGFHTILTDAIVLRPSTFNGNDSIEFEGSLSRVEKLQNVARATVWGVQAGIEIFFKPGFSWQTQGNWITGKETDDNNNEQVPLRHAPPFYGNSLIRYRNDKWQAEVSVVYNSEISNRNLAPSEKGKRDIYASDKNGLPYSPGWYTLNFKTSFQLNTQITITAGWENITNQRYRPYSSGIVAAGSNLVFSLRAMF